jgi:hypothetical protein
MAAILPGLAFGGSQSAGKALKQNFRFTADFPADCRMPEFLANYA